MSEGLRAFLGVAVSIGVVAVGAPTPARGDSADAQQVVEATVNQILDVLADPQLTGDQRRAQIEEIAYQRFHFDTMSRLVLARRWKSLSPDQQREFMQEFRLLLSRSYGRRLDRYEQESVEILAARKEPRGDVTVHTRIVGGQADNFEIDYRMRRRDGTWGVIDVVVEGVSLVSSYRSQFQELLGNGGPEALLERLREKNARSEPDAEEAAPGAS